MIQRLLRGRFLYVMLVVVTLFLYGRAITVKPFNPVQFENETVSFDRVKTEPVETWPKELNPEAIKRIVAHEPSIMVPLCVLGLFIAVMTIGGLALSVQWLVSGRAGPRARSPAQPILPWTLGEFWRIIALLLLVVSLMPFVRLAMTFPHIELVEDHFFWAPLAMCMLDLFVILTILTFAVGKGKRTGDVLGIARNDLPQVLATALRGYMAVFPWIFALLFLAVEFTTRFGIKVPVEPIQELIFKEQRPAVLGITVFLACVIAPVAEELFFRGVLYGALRRRTSQMTAMLITGALFAVIHTNPVGFLSIMVLGCLLAHLYERTGSLAGPLIVHMLHNTFLMSLALIFRHVTALV